MIQTSVPGGHYSLKEAVSNPVHTERSGRCAGIGMPTPLQVPRRHYLVTMARYCPQAQHAKVE